MSDHSSNTPPKPVRERNGTARPSDREPENTSDQDRPERAPWYEEDDMSMIQTTHEGSPEQVDKEQNDHSAASIGSSQRPSAQDGIEKTDTSTSYTWDILRTPSFQPTSDSLPTTSGNGVSQPPAPPQNSPDPFRNLEPIVFTGPIDQDTLDRLAYPRSDSK